MKVGDLVRLSAYGQDRDYNLWLAREPQVGLIIKVLPGRNYPYYVQWTKVDPGRSDRFPPAHSRLELKYARR